MPAVAIPIAIAAGTSIAGSVIGSNASSNAASTQASSTSDAAKLQKQAADAALAEQKRQFDIGQSNLQPWLTAGTAGLSQLMNGLGINVPSTSGSNPITTPRSTQTQTGNTADPYADQRSALQGQIDHYQQLLDSGNQGYQPSLYAKEQIRRAQEQLSQLPAYTAQTPTTTTTTAAADPRGSATDNRTNRGNATGYGDLMASFTNEDFVKDPGYDFRMQEGADLVSQSAAARGMPFGGAAAKALTRYGQDYASNEYMNAYNRFNTDQANRYNRLASLAGVGQTTANTLNTTGQNYANNVSNIGMSSAASQGDYLTQAANARASGYMGSANAWSSGLSSLGGVLSDYFATKYSIPKQTN